MFTKFPKKTLFSKIISGIVAVSFILTSVPIRSYAAQGTADKLRTDGTHNQKTLNDIARDMGKVDGGSEVAYGVAPVITPGTQQLFIPPQILALGNNATLPEGARTGRRPYETDAKAGADGWIINHSEQRKELEGKMRNMLDSIVGLAAQKHIRLEIKTKTQAFLRVEELKDEVAYTEEIDRQIRDRWNQSLQVEGLSAEEIKATLSRLDEFLKDIPKYIINKSVQTPEEIKKGDLYIETYARRLVNKVINSQLKKIIELSAKYPNISKGLTCICVGETIEQEKARIAEQVIREDLEQILEGITLEQLKLIHAVNGYEPRSYIAKGETPPYDVIEARHKFIKEVVEGIKLIGAKPKVLYGASLSGKNALPIFRLSGVDGGIPGGASEDPATLAPIVEAAITAGEEKGGEPLIILGNHKASTKAKPIKEFVDKFKALDLSEVQVAIATNDVGAVKKGMFNLNQHLAQLFAESQQKAGPYDDGFPKIATFDDIGKTIDVRNKVVLYRPDINVAVPLDPNHGRFIFTAASLKELLDNGAKVVVIYHQGRTGDPNFIEDPFQHAEILNRLVGGNRVRAINDLFGKEAIAAIKGLKAGQCIVLKQVRANDPLTGKTLEESSWFVPTLRPLVDYFVLGGLSTLHREGNSITGLKGVRTIADRLMEEEIRAGLNERNPAKPHLEVAGGSKVEKIKAIINELNGDGKTDMILVGGVPAEAALVAAQMEKGKDYTEDELLVLAKAVLGPAAGESLQRADAGQFFALLPQLAEVIQKNHNKIALPVDMAYMEGETPRSVTLINGRVSEGFNYTFSGIGSETDALFASIVRRTDNPFKSANLTGPLVDSRKKALLPFMAETTKALSQIEKWSTAGGDTKNAIEALGVIPPFSSLAGGAWKELVDGKRLAGIDVAINNSPEALKGKTFVPTTDAEAHVLAHTNVFSSLAKAMQAAGGKLVARTNIFIRGQAVESIKISPTAMDTVLRLSMGDLANVYTGLQVKEIDGQNTWIDFSMTTLRAPANDRRKINVGAVRQVLSVDPNIAVVLLQGEYNKKKDKYGTPGEIDVKSLEERLNSLLTRILRTRGIDPTAMPKTGRPLPSLVQVTESGIPGQLKMAVFVATPNTDIYRLMQLAQDSGINLKEIFEQSKDINDHAFIKTMQALKAQPQLALLGEPLPVPPAPLQAPIPDSTEFATLEGLTFGGAKINIKTQTIISKNTEGNLTDIWSILERVRQTKKLVRIMVPEGSKIERRLEDVLSSGIEGNIEQIRGLNFTRHSVTRGRDKFTAFIISPEVPYVIVGYGNEAIKVAPVLQASGIGKPAVAINSLSRIERVIHAFLMGYDVYHADQVLVDKDTQKEVFLYDLEPKKLKEFENNLFNALVNACTVKARDELLAELSLSERADSTKTKQVITQSKEKGRQEARERFSKQYKGLLSIALNAGKFKVIVDATPEKIGEQNKRLLYEPAGKLHPDMLFIYQGGEKAGVGYSFCNVSTDYSALRSKEHVRHVSCNTTALSTIGLSLIDFLGAALDIDNLAIRRVKDPGDDKGDKVTTKLSFAYHHWPDVEEVTPDYIEVLGNTDAAQAGAVTMYHHHILSLVRSDGQPIDINKIKENLAARPDVALVDFPAGVFNSVRIVELAHNLLPQAVRNAPDGANHLLVPVVTVQPTDDPAEAVLIVAVPQESIVARGQAHIIHAALGMASKDASTEIVNDAVGATALVEGIETRLAADILTEETLPSLTLNSPAQEEILKEDKGIYDAQGGKHFDNLVESAKEAQKPAQKVSGKLDVSTVTAETIFDSRNKPTVRVTLKIGGISLVGEVPAGASKGGDEAMTVDTKQAIKNINEIITPVLQKSNLDLSKYEDLIKAEKMIIEVAGKNCKQLGANAVVPVSWALWKMAAKLNNMELWEYIRKNAPEVVGNDSVYFYMNIYNGGLHAAKDGEKLGQDRIDIQEIMIVPVGAKTHSQALEMGDKVDQELKKILEAEFSKTVVFRADEAGFSVKGLGDSTKAIGYVIQAIKNAGYKPGEDVKLALDVAATSFYKEAKGAYEFQGQDLTSEQMINYYISLVDKYPGIIISIEDGLAENDWSGWSKLTAEMKKHGIITIGDDLFVTQLLRLEKGIEDKAATAILIKVNQNNTGTVSGTLDVIKHAIKNGLKIVVSHRSGETLDNAIADLAYATKALGLKTGDPQPTVDFQDKTKWVRRNKYLRMVEIQEIQNNKGHAWVFNSEFFKTAAAISALLKTTELLGDNLKIVLYGKPAAKVGDLLGNNKNILVTDTLDAAISQLENKNIRPENITLARTYLATVDEEKIDPRIKQIVFTKDGISTIILAKLLRETFNVSGVNNAFENFYAEITDPQQGVVLADGAYANTIQHMRGEVKTGEPFYLPGMTAHLGSDVEKAAESVRNFIFND